MEPEEFPNFEKVQKEYKSIVHKPLAVLNEGIFTVKFFIWDQYNGNLERWEMKFTKKGKVISARKRLLSERIGHYRGSKLSILTFPE